MNLPPLLRPVLQTLVGALPGLAAGLLIVRGQKYRLSYLRSPAWCAAFSARRPGRLNGAMYMRLRPILWTLVSALLGLAVGILTVLGQKYLPGNLNSLANSGAVWLVPAFFTASRQQKRAYCAISATLCLLGCVFGYYVFEAIFNAHEFHFGNLANWVWVACAFVGGVAFGAGAYLWKMCSAPWNYVGMAMLPSAFLAEGITMLLHYDSYLHMLAVPIVWVVVGLLLLVFFFRQQMHSPQALPVALGVVGAGLLGYAVLFRVL